jgi:hypothetical protein
MNSENCTSLMRYLIYGASMVFALTASGIGGMNTPAQAAQAQATTPGLQGDAGQPSATPPPPPTQTTQGDAGTPPTLGADGRILDVPSATCRPGYIQQGFRLCITGSRGPASFANAFLDCMDSGGRVANYHDWRYRIFRGDGLPGPVGWWLGPITADNTALYVNLPNVADFDGETSRFDLRNYACAHDLIR